jgi:hypothetical protein
MSNTLVDPGLYTNALTANKAFYNAGNGTPTTSIPEPVEA